MKKWLLLVMIHISNAKLFHVVASWISLNFELRAGPETLIGDHF